MTSDAPAQTAPAPAPASGSAGSGVVSGAPQGGVATGAGGTAPAQGPDAVLLGLASGALVLMATGGGVLRAARRTAGLTDCARGVVRPPPRDATRVPLAGPVTLGRSPASTVVLHDLSVSRRHARIRLGDSGDRCSKTPGRRSARSSTARA